MRRQASTMSGSEDQGYPATCFRLLFPLSFAFLSFLLSICFILFFFLLLVLLTSSVRGAATRVSRAITTWDTQLQTALHLPRENCPFTSKAGRKKFSKRPDANQGFSFAAKSGRLDLARISSELSGDRSRSPPTHRRHNATGVSNTPS